MASRQALVCPSAKPSLECHNHLLYEELCMQNFSSLASNLWEEIEMTEERIYGHGSLVCNMAATFDGVVISLLKEGFAFFKHKKFLYLLNFYILWPNMLKMLLHIIRIRTIHFYYQPKSICWAFKAFTLSLTKVFAMFCTSSWLNIFCSTRVDAFDK